MKTRKLSLLVLTGSIYGFMLVVSSICSATSYPTSTATPLATDLSINQYKLTDVGDIITKDPWVDARQYTTLKAAVTGIGSTNETTLVIPQLFNVNDGTAETVTVTPNITLQFIKAGKLVKVGSGTVAINGPFQSPLKQVFSGFNAGDVLFNVLATNATYLAEVYSEWFGAKGNSSTDCTTAIQSAIQSLGLRGGRVRFLPGTYRITGITIPQRGIHLLGAGNQEFSEDIGGHEPSGTILILTGASDGKAITISGDTNFGSIRDLGLARTSPGTTVGIYVAGVGENSSGGIHDFTFERLTIHGFDKGISLKNSWINRIVDCQIGPYETGTYKNNTGIELAYCHAFEVTGTRFHRNDIGIQAIGCIGLNITENVFELHNLGGTSATAVSVDATSWSRSKVNIHNNYFEKNHIAVYVGNYSPSKNWTSVQNNSFNDSDTDLVEYNSERLELHGNRWTSSGVSVWVASTNYAINDMVRPTVGKRTYIVTTDAGSSGSSEPTWPTTLGATVVDGGITWTTHSVDYDDSNTVDKTVQFGLYDKTEMLFGGLKILRGAGSPEGVYTAPIGSQYYRTNGGASTTLYIKESGTGNTGWVAK